MVTKKITAAIPMMDDKKWQAESDMQTLARAKEIEADRARLTAAKRIAEQKIKQMQSVVAKKTTPTVRKK